jgi:hypothetical protein
LLCRSGPRWLLGEGAINEFGSTVKIVLTSGAAGAKHATNSRRGTRIELWTGVKTKGSGIQLYHVQERIMECPSPSTSR